jgi:hypothetical protein
MRSSTSTRKIKHVRPGKARKFVRWEITEKPDIKSPEVGVVRTRRAVYTENKTAYAIYLKLIRLFPKRHKPKYKTAYAKIVNGISQNSKRHMPKCEKYYVVLKKHTGVFNLNVYDKMKKA